MQIKEAIELFNSKRGDKPKLTHETIGAFVFHDEELASVTKRGFITSWCNDKHMGKMKPKHIRRLCALLSVDANYLYDIPAMPKK